jgi:hypothetical protein
MRVGFFGGVDQGPSLGLYYHEWRDAAGFW